jgi:hypothetical protein
VASESAWSKAATSSSSHSTSTTATVLSAQGEAKDGTASEPPGSQASTEGPSLNVFTVHRRASEVQQGLQGSKQPASERRNREQDDRRVDAKASCHPALNRHRTAICATEIDFFRKQRDRSYSRIGVSNETEAILALLVYSRKSEEVDHVHQKHAILFFEDSRSPLYKAARGNLSQETILLKDRTKSTSSTLTP